MTAGAASAFSFEGPQRSLPLRALNAAGAPFVRVVSLAPDAIVRAAERRTRLSADGDDAFREPLARLCEAIEADARLHVLGRWLVRAQLVDVVAERLRLRDHLARRPEVAAVPIERPLFVLGHPRTGSTFLHNLLALDPASRAPALWELLHPVPRRGRRRDPRLAEARAMVRGIERLSPVTLKIHPMTADGPEECRFLLEKTFVGLQFMAYYRIPRYVEWFARLGEERRTAACLEARRQMQVLKHGDGGRRWVGKSTAHVALGRSLTRAFPDACVVLLHRDPAEALPSICSLAAASRSIFSDAVDPRELGPETLPLLDLALERMRELRAAPPPATFCEIRYEQLVADPLATVRRIYDTAGLALSAAVERRMRAYVAAHPQHAGGVHRYTPEQFGITRVDIERAVARHAGWLDGFGRG